MENITTQPRLILDHHQTTAAGTWTSTRHPGRDSEWQRYTLQDSWRIVCSPSASANRRLETETDETETRVSPHYITLITK